MSIYRLNITTNLPDHFDPEHDDPSLNNNQSDVLHHEFKVDIKTLNRLFFARYQLEYISRYFYSTQNILRVLTYPQATNTCYEKASVLKTWNPLNFIKAFYLTSTMDGSLYAVIIPETGCFIDKSQLKKELDLSEADSLIKAAGLPTNMSYGICSPFIGEQDLLGNGGRVKKIVFDIETLTQKKHENTLDDFSFGLDHRVSVQMNYYQCYKMLKSRFPKVVIEREVLKLAFKENFVRKEGQIKIDFEFQSLDYRTAKFINSIHGNGDVSIINDYIDELNLPDVLTSQKKICV